MSGEDSVQIQHETGQHSFVGNGSWIVQNHRRFTELIDVDLLQQWINKPSHSNTAARVFDHLVLQINQSICFRSQLDDKVGRDRRIRFPIVDGKLLPSVGSNP